MRTGILLVIALATTGCLCSETLEMDKCLDLGGRWDESRKVCETEASVADAKPGDAAAVASTNTAVAPVAEPPRLEVPTPLKDLPLPTPLPPIRSVPCQF